MTKGIKVIWPPLTFDLILSDSIEAAAQNRPASGGVIFEAHIAALVIHRDVLTASADRRRMDIIDSIFE